MRTCIGERKKLILHTYILKPLALLVFFAIYLSAILMYSLDPSYLTCGTVSVSLISCHSNLSGHNVHMLSVSVRP